MFRVPVVPLASALILIVCPSLSQAQAKDSFVQALADFVNAAHGAAGDEGAALTAALGAMAEGLSQWDAAVARVEAGFASEAGTAPPPVAARMRTALGAVYLERGRADAAIEQFAAAAGLDPQFADVHMLRGLAYEMTAQPDAAAAAYRDAWSRDRQSAANAYRFLSSTPALAGSAEAGAALRLLSAALERGGGGSSSPGGLFITMTLLDDASAPAPVFPPAAYVPAFRLVREARYEEALALLRQAVEGDPLTSDRVLQTEEARQTAAALRRRDGAAAIASAQAAAAKAPASPEAHRLLAIAYRAGGRFDESLAELRTAVRLNPRDERSHLAIADVLAEAGNPADAREALGNAVQAIPGSGQAHWELGRLHQAFGDERNALRSFQTAASLVPHAGAGHVHAAIARLHQNQLDLDAAAAAYARRITRAPNDSGAHFDLGEVYRAQEKLDEALAEYTVAALLDSTNANAYSKIGQVHAAAGRDEDAVRMLRKAVALDGGLLEPRYALSRALLRLGRTDEAREELKVFEQLQAKAMEEERRRFQENQLKIEDALKSGGAERRR